MRIGQSGRGPLEDHIARCGFGRAVAVVGLLLVVAVSPILGQGGGLEGRYRALAGLAEVAWSATVEWDMGITMRGGMTQGEFDKHLERGLLVGLEGTGVKTADSALGRLDCRVRLTLLEDVEPIVVVFWTARVLRPENVDEPAGPWRVVWSVGEMGTRIDDALSGSEVGGDCAAAFGRDWSRANPGTRGAPKQQGAAKALR